jgi:hypothetical protein
MMDIAAIERSFSPSEFEELRAKTLEQVEKDFALQGVSIQLTKDDRPYEELVDSLAVQMEESGVFHGSKLSALLYQLDVSEAYVMEAILPLPESEKLKRLSDVVIKRCFAKVFYRKKYQ